MDIITASENEFEDLALRHDPIYNGINTLVDTLIQFIRARKLIIYGGLAIDYALRLHGDKIYPDNMLQVDYDFLSPQHIDHAYELADTFYSMILESHGETEAAGVRAINATHIKTMRVDVRDNHFLADVTYCPADIFEKIPVLIYNGIRIIHPDMQRIDIHSSLSFPYDNPPTEVIFSRWKKDIKRFNLLAKYYPITGGSASGIDNGNDNADSANNDTTGSDSRGDGTADSARGRGSANNDTTGSGGTGTSDTMHVGTITVPNEVSKYVLTGFSAYGIVYNTIASQHSLPADIIRPGPALVQTKRGGANSDVITLHGSTLEIAHMHPDKCAGELSLSHIEHYRPVINMIPETMIGQAAFGRVKIDATTGRMLSYVSAQVDGRVYRCACTQYLLRQFLAEYHYARMRDDPTADIYLQHYVSLMRLMEYKHEITGLSITTYGYDNVSLSKEIALKRVFADIGQAVSEYLPMNYYPAKRGDLPRPQYDITRNVIFQESGEMLA